MVESQLVHRFENQLPEPIKEDYAQNFVHATGSPEAFDKQAHPIVCFECFGELVHKAFNEHRW